MTLLRYLANHFLKGTKSSLTPPKKLIRSLLSLEALEARLNPAASIFQNQVSNLYQIALNRAPDPQGLASFTARLEQGQPLEQISRDIFHSHERNTRLVAGYYQSLLKRTPDAVGLASMVAAADQGVSEKNILTGFLASHEFSGAMNNTQFVSELYYVILNRNGDAGGLSAHVQQLNSGMSRSTLVKAFFDSSELSERVAGNLYGKLLGRAAGQNEIMLWTSQLVQPNYDITDAVTGFIASAEGNGRMGTVGLGTKLPTDLWWHNFVGISLDAAKGSVQELSGNIADLLRQRKTAEDANLPIDLIDKALSLLENRRYQALANVVIAANPQAREIDRAAQQFSVPVPGNDQRLITGYSSPIVAWNAKNLTPVMGQFMDQSRGISPDPLLITSNQTLAGSSNWSGFYPYPGDYDCSEEWDLTAPDSSTAADRVVKAFLDYAIGQNTAKYSNFEFWRLRINYRDPATDTDKIANWTLPDLVDAVTNPAKQEEMKNQILNLNNKRIGFNFRAILDDGRFTHMQKVIGVHATGTNGTSFFDSEVDYPNQLDGFDPHSDETETFFRSQQISAKYQEIFVVGHASKIDPESLGDYASTMWRLAIKEVDQNQRYLKAANRAFAYFRAIGNIEGMEAIKPVYQTQYSLMNQRNQMLDTVADALDNTYPTRILTAAKARDQLLGAANDVQSLGNGTYSNSLRQIAGSFQGIDGNLDSPLKPDSVLETALNQVDDDITLAINDKVADQVKPVIEKYLRNFHQ